MEFSTFFRPARKNEVDHESGQKTCQSGTYVDKNSDLFVIHDIHPPICRHIEAGNFFFRLITRGIDANNAQMAGTF